MDLLELRNQPVMFVDQHPLLLLKQPSHCILVLGLGMGWLVEKDADPVSWAVSDAHVVQRK